MLMRTILQTLVFGILLAISAPLLYADGPKIGFSINVEGDGFFLNPVVTKIRIDKVEKASLAESAGILAGDEILQIEGQPVVGKRARDLEGFIQFGPGETRTLRLKHANGEQFVARLTKPKA